MTPEQKRAHARGFPVHVGVDTGKAFHVLVAQGPEGRRTKGYKVLVGRAAFEQTTPSSRPGSPACTATRC